MNSNACCVNCNHKKFTCIYGLIECQIDNTIKTYDAFCSNFSGYGIKPLQSKPKEEEIAPKQEITNPDVTVSDSIPVEVADKLPKGT